MVQHGRVSIAFIRLSTVCYLFSISCRRCRTSIKPENAEWGTNFAEKSVDQLMNFGIARTHLGKTISITAKDSRDFGRQIGKYVDSK